ncbi:MAG: hypothetical protein NVS1B6_01980 [Steroidobacteraceae bacterium]
MDSAETHSPARVIAAREAFARLATARKPKGIVPASNLSMAESKIGMRAMQSYNKIALSLCRGDAIL